MLLCCTLLIGERLQLVDQAFGMDPTQGMPADIELAGMGSPAGLFKTAR
jgi:hypothetical protein